MIDLHTHTFFSDGELLPSELVQRAETLGLAAVAITDHLDMSNLDLVLPRILTAARELNRVHQVQTLAGAELTHVPPSLIAGLTARARELGAQVVVVHGETIVEPVPPGTNRAALEAGVDILAHPGLITREEVQMAAERGVHLEISARKGHSLANGHVAALARQLGAKLVINTDAHAPSDLMGLAFARKVGLAAGLSEAEVDAALANSRRLVERALGA
ncbi:MAG: histidinol phosphate phosphatase domain-containing protein [Deltaproteobacteria bacterium]|nr:histidinol phosphate phosphatase domain-containing protein [Deltaproteobacteria bacterium]